MLMYDTRLEQHRKVSEYLATKTQARDLHGYMNTENFNMVFNITLSLNWLPGRLILV